MYLQCNIIWKGCGSDGNVAVRLEYRCNDRQSDSALPAYATFFVWTDTTYD